ncbi:MAG: acetolactate synthase small subunit [Bdellovibrionales bacterium]
MSNEQILRQCFALLVDNQPGVLARVVGMFAGRGYNIDSLTVDKVDVKSNLSRIMIVSHGTREALDQVTAQLQRLMPVRRLLNLTEAGPLVERSCALLKVKGDEAQRTKAVALAEGAGAKEIEQTDTTVMFEICAAPQQVADLIEALRSVGLAEIASSGSVAMGSGETTIL